RQRKRARRQHGVNIGRGRGSAGRVLLLVRQAGAFGGRPEPAQQRIDRQRNNAHHGDFAQRIKATEIDQDHVYHIGAAPFGQRLVDKERRDGLLRATGQDGIGKRRHRRAGYGGNDEIARAAQLGARFVAFAVQPAFDTARQPAQARQQQHHSHHFDGQLRERQVGRREPAKSHANGQACAPGKNQGGQAVILGLERSAYRAD